MGYARRIGSIVLILLVAGVLVPGGAQGMAVAQDGPGDEMTERDSVGENTYADVGEDDEDVEYEDEDEEEDETGAQLVGDWWGLGEEAQEAPYIGLVELGVGLLIVGVAGYSLGKRTSVVPLRHRKRLLQGHELTMLAGTALVAPHFIAVEEWEGLGLLVGLLIGIEVISGLYGRHLHRHVLRFGRGDERAPFVGRFLEITKKTVLIRWRRIHVLLTVVTAVALLLHIVTAIGG